jgi:hypothetical protein
MSLAAEARSSGELGSGSSGELGSRSSEVVLQDAKHLFPLEPSFEIAQQPRVLRTSEQF